MQADVRFVLVETSHPGNIGAAARAMKNMQFDQLYLVQPKVFPHADATARASGADDVLEKAKVCSSLQDALLGCSVVYGASARQRTIAWPVEDPKQCAQYISGVAENTTAAVVFGRERTGLTNEELDLCHKMLHIPCNPDYSSLNVAAALQIVAYELRVASNAPAISQNKYEERDRAATHDEVERFHQHLHTVMVATEFLDPDNPRQLSRRLRRLFNRCEPSSVELNILRGILTSVEKSLGKPN